MSESINIPPPTEAAPPPPAEQLSPRGKKVPHGFTTPPHNHSELSRSPPASYTSSTSSAPDRAAIAASPQTFDPMARKHTTMPNYRASSAPRPRRSRALSSPTGEAKRVLIKIPTSEMQVMGSEQVRVYNIQIYMEGALLEDIQRRYSVLLEAHKELLKQRIPRTLPKFPPKRWYADFSKPDVVEKRRKELVKYLNEVFSIPEVIACQHFLSVLSVSESTATVLNAVAKEKRQQQVQAKQHKEHQQVTDYERAQAFHAQYPQALVYTHVIDLHMTEQSLSWETAVLGPGNYTWFRLRPTKSSIERNLAIITNNADQPLVTIMEDRSVFSSQATFHIFFVDPSADFKTTCCNMTEVGKSLICTVEVQRNAFVNDDYFVKMKDGSVIQCVGDWGNRKFEFFVRGVRHPVARIRERQGTHAADTFRLQVTPGQDILMYVSIAACLEHVHQEIVAN